MQHLLLYFVLCNKKIVSLYKKKLLKKYYKIRFIILKITFLLVLQIKFDFAIIISGFKSLCAPHAIYYDGKINIPSLHIYGKTDKVIPTGKIFDF